MGIKIQSLRFGFLHLEGDTLEQKRVIQLTRFFTVILALTVALYVQPKLIFFCVATFFLCFMLVCSLDTLKVFLDITDSFYMSFLYIPLCCLVVLRLAVSGCQKFMNS